MDALASKLGQLAEDLTYAETLAADYDDGKLDREIENAKQAVFRAGARVFALGRRDLGVSAA